MTRPLNQRHRREVPGYQASKLKAPRKLSTRASSIVAESLLNQPKPNAKLRELLSEKRRKKRVKVWSAVAFIISPQS